MRSNLEEKKRERTALYKKSTIPEKQKNKRQEEVGRNSFGREKVKKRNRGPVDHEINSS